ADVVPSYHAIVEESLCVGQECGLDLLSNNVAHICLLKLKNGRRSPPQPPTSWTIVVGQAAGAGSFSLNFPDGICWTCHFGWGILCCLPIYSPGGNRPKG